jgi:hypothetical protein
MANASSYCYNFVPKTNALLETMSISVSLFDFDWFNGLSNHTKASSDFPKSLEMINNIRQKLTNYL